MATANNNRQHHDIFGSAPVAPKSTTTTTTTAATAAAATATAAAATAAAVPAGGPATDRDRDMVQRVQRSTKNQTRSSVDPGHSPWATEMSSSDLATAFDALERSLTSLIPEQTGLRAESEKLHGRGGKTLRDRTRLVQVEMRLGEVEKGISSSRKQLLTRPQ